MLHKFVFSILCSGLAACAIAPPAPIFNLAPMLPTQAPSGDLATDRRACNTAYPPKIGNYLSHAKCVNAAVERDAIPRARYPDLVRLQERLRISYSAQIDNGKVTPKTGERNMAEEDELVANATIERDAGRSEVAADQVARLETILRH
jgi:hypothetical protein